MPEIVLVRHGPPACPKPRFCRAEAFNAWVQAYHHAPLEPDAEPPAGLVEALADSRIILCSPLTRAIGSAGRLFPGRSFEVDDALREAEVPNLRLAGLRLPVDLWLVLARLAWLGGAHQGCESLGEARQRAASAARRLMVRAAEDGKIAVIGHGWLHRMIGRTLGQAGWSRTSGGSGYWEAIVWRKAR